MLSQILVPIDTSAIAEQALPIAGAIARRSGAALTLVLVHQPTSAGGYQDAPWNAGRRAIERAYLDAQANELEARFKVRVTTAHPGGSAAAVLAKCIEDRHADLVVMTTHGRTGLSRAWIGSVADALMRSVNVPILMLRPNGKRAVTEPGVFHKVMLPLDGSANAERIIDPALALAGTAAAYFVTEVVEPVPLIVPTSDPYTMVPTIPDEEATAGVVAEATQYVRGVAARLVAQKVGGIEHTVNVAQHIAARILELATLHHVDLIALATRGRGASRLVIGSVADKVLRGSTIPLLVLNAATPPASR